jgi:uncharacterized membrane protein YidH (DUF202 family)
MSETRIWSIRRIATELAILAIAIGVSYGVVELLRFTFDMPATRMPILAVIALAVLTARLGFTEWLQNYSRSAAKTHRPTTPHRPCARRRSSPPSA